MRRLFLAICVAAAALVTLSCAEAQADHGYRSYGYYGHRQAGYVGFNWHNPGYFFPRQVYRPYAVYQAYPLYSRAYSYPMAPVHQSYEYSPYYDNSNNVYISGPNYNFGVGGY
jgi:hypothetical protein